MRGSRKEGIGVTFDYWTEGQNSVIGLPRGYSRGFVVGSRLGLDTTGKGWRVDAFL